MKPNFRISFARTCWLAGLLALRTVCGVVAADFQVTTPGFYYSINGSGQNPDITVVRGTTYTFAVNAASIHPFQISSDPSGTPYDNGVLNNNITQGTITFTVPTDAPDTLYYVCTIHFFYGTIHVINPTPPPPPNVKIISVSYTSNSVTLQSTGTNGWTAIPEFRPDLFAGSWLTVPGYGNTYSNGINITTFGRLEPIYGPNVFLRIQNTNQ
jgi:hypothetical protein